MKPSTSKRDETAKLAAAFAARLSVKEVAGVLQVSELEAANLIVRGRVLAQSKGQISANMGASKTTGGENV